MKRVKLVVQLLVGAMGVCLAVALVWPSRQEPYMAEGQALAAASHELNPDRLSSVVAGRAYQTPKAASGESGAGWPAAVVAGQDSDIQRKIVYQATIALHVEDFSGASQKVVELVKQFEGYVADSTLEGKPGENRSSTWKIRVPLGRFEEFVGAAKGLGELISAGTTSQDVSEEYYDVDARIRNKTKEEERLIKLLEERQGKLEDVIAIERELSRVREELERMQGRMRVLADLTSMTTVRLAISETRHYEPAEAPSLATRLRRALEGSVDSLRAAAESTLVNATAALPWLAVLSIAGMLIYLPLRRRLMSRRESVLAA
jgi:hypothetical protein